MAHANWQRVSGNLGEAFPAVTYHSFEDCPQGLTSLVEPITAGGASTNTSRQQVVSMRATSNHEGGPNGFRFSPALTRTATSRLRHSEWIEYRGGGHVTRVPNSSCLPSLRFHDRGTLHQVGVGSTVSNATTRTPEVAIRLIVSIQIRRVNRRPGPSRRKAD